MRSRDEIIDEDDFFKDTRMSFGDHLEVLRAHLWRAIYGLLFCMGIGFVLDSIGKATGRDYIGIGRPLMEIIQAPVKQALAEFYDRRMQRLQQEKNQENSPAAQAAQPRRMRLRFSREDLARIPGLPADQLPESIDLTPIVDPVEVYEINEQVTNFIRPRELTTLSAQEGFVIYFKISLIAGLVIASPWVFWQIWSFVAAGLYPHEKRYVHTYLPISVVLFVFGVVLCQFFVMPKTVAALLWFNEYVGVTPDLRLSEWLGLAILLPVVFGLSFQTPLVMMFLERLGLADADTFKRKRKYAMFGLAVFAAVITPTPDAITMMYLWLPMVALYEFGVWLAVLSPHRRRLDDVDVPESEELIEV
jgi:sec-independent protein translocase protein TatC